MKKLLVVFLLAVAGGICAFLAIQFIPLNRKNPPAVTQVRWDSPQTEALFGRACADCHSNETVWPWYSYVAPVSWLVVRDVNEGRDEFNISDLNALRSHDREELPEEVGETIREGEMPTAMYVMMHRAARLTREEKQALITGLEKTLRDSLVDR